MALTSSSLSTGLQNLPLTTDAVAAKLAFAQAYGDYMKSALAGVVPIVASIIDSSGVPAMVAAMTLPLSGTTSTAAAAIQAGVVAFWADMTAKSATYFVGGSALVISPLQAGMGVLLSPVFDLNINLARSKVVSCDAVADVMHTATLGGTVTIATIVTAII